MRGVRNLEVRTNQSTSAAALHIFIGRRSRDPTDDREIYGSSSHWPPSPGFGNCCTSSAHRLPFVSQRNEGTSRKFVFMGSIDDAGWSRWSREESES